MNDPIFLVGSERSGTTLLRLMLDAHPKVAWCNEFEYTIDRVDDDGTYPDATDYAEWLSTHRIFQQTGFQLDPAVDYREQVRGFLRQRMQRTNKTRVGATVHRHYHRLRLLWPECRFIYLYRDGRDVARSIVTMGWAGNVWRAIPRWLDAEQQWASLRANLAPNDWVEVKYESLIGDPRRELTKICDFVGVPYDEHMLRYHENTTYSPPDPNLTEQWRVKLSPRQLGVIEAIAGDQLQRRGYELSGHPQVHLSPLQRRLAQMDDIVRRQRWRYRRYGIATSLGESLSKRFGPRSTWLRCKKRINEIDTRHFK